VGDKILTVRVPEEVLARLRRRYEANDDVQAAEKALTACAEETLSADEQVSGWDALDKIIGIAHGGGTPGADQHDRYGLGAQ
jgi:hypothetical protein